MMDFTTLFSFQFPKGLRRFDVGTETVLLDFGQSDVADWKPLNGTFNAIDAEYEALCADAQALV